jgi:filamentous hemagglutinin
MVGHFVVVEGVNGGGSVLVRDPPRGFRYAMKMKDFLQFWTGEAAYKPR